MKQKKSQLKLSTRLIFLVSVLLGALVATNAISMFNINRIGIYLVEIAEEDIPLTNHLSQVLSNQLSQAFYLERALRVSFEYDQNHPDVNLAKDKFLRHSELVNAELKSSKELAAAAKELAHNEVAMQKFNDVGRQLIDIEAAHKEFDVHSMELFDRLESSSDGTVIEEMINGITHEEEKLIHALELLLHDVEKFTADTALEAEQLEKDSIVLIFMLSIVAITIGLFVSITTYLSVRKQMGHDPLAIEKFAMDISDGELRPHPCEETQKKSTGVFYAMVGMRKGLSEVVDAIKMSASQVESGSMKIAQGNLDLSARTEEQSSNLQETASNMTEITSSVKHNAVNASRANELAKAARDQAQSGGSVVGNAITAMGEITDSSIKIADIINIIDEIAFQTNLLALNAAVEAARAGEQGRGFAVVATEVRSLAGRSATAAREIKDLIQDSVEKVESGTVLVNQSGETLAKIVDSVKNVTDVVGEISTACQEQSVGIEHVNNAISYLDGLTQQNAVLVEQVAASSKSIGEQAKDLSESVAFFKTV